MVDGRHSENLKMFFFSVCVYISRKSTNFDNIQYADTNFSLIPGCTHKFTFVICYVT